MGEQLKVYVAMILPRIFGFLCSHRWCWKLTAVYDSRKSNKHAKAFNILKGNKEPTTWTRSWLFHIKVKYIAL